MVLRKVGFRLLGMIPTLLLVVLMVFLLIHLVPGDPVEALLGERASPVDREALRASLGLDLPLWQQFLGFVGGLLQGDWGTSLVAHRPVLALMGERMGATVFLAAVSMGIAVCFGGLLGVGMVVRQAALRGALDVLTLALMVVPSFVLGPLLIVGVSVRLGWLPVSGWDGWQGVILPALTLGLGLGAVLARMLAASLRAQLGADYLRTVKAKGGSGWRALVRHALPNALLPMIQVFFLQAGMVLTGAVLTEAVFGWPGVGNLLVDALHQRDYPVIQGCLLFISLVYMLSLLLADLVSGLVDPRIR